MRIFFVISSINSNWWGFLLQSISINQYQSINKNQSISINKYQSININQSISIQSIQSILNILFLLLFFPLCFLPPLFLFLTLLHTFFSFLFSPSLSFFSFYTFFLSFFPSSCSFSSPSLFFFLPPPLLSADAICIGTITLAVLGPLKGFYVNCEVYL